MGNGGGACPPSRPPLVCSWCNTPGPARGLASSLRWRAIVDGHDISDGYHISMLTGCTGELVVYGWGITGVRRVYDGDPE